MEFHQLGAWDQLYQIAWGGGGLEPMEIPELLTQISTDSSSPKVENRNLHFIMLPGDLIGEVPVFERLCGKKEPEFIPVASMNVGHTL